MKRCQAFAVISLLALAGCTSAASTTAAPVSPPVATEAVSALPSLVASPPQYPASWILPDKNLTPGALQPGVTLKDLCPHVSPALEAQRPSSGAKRVIYAQYGIVHHAPGAYEIDHLVPVELGGLVPAPAGRVAENLWPEPADKPDPAMIRKYHLRASYVHNSKDIAEDVVHHLVCGGKVPLATAQAAFEQDWRTAYVRWVGPPPS